MDTNNRLLKIVLWLVGIAAVVIIVAITYLKLDKPVFLKHYYDIRVLEDGTYHPDIRLVYITNVDDTRVVNHLEFPDAPEMVVHASEYGFPDFYWGYGQADTPGEIAGRYRVRTVYCQFDIIPDIAGIDGAVFDRARVFFNDGSEMDVQLGELHFYTFGFDDHSLDSLSASSTSDGYSSSRYRATEDITLLSVQNPMLERLEDRLDIKINNHEMDMVNGVEIKEGEYLEIVSKIYPGDNPIETYEMVDIHPELAYENKDGGTGSLRFYNIDRIHHSFNFLDIYRYFDYRGVL